MMNVLDLFSGIGGFSLGLERTGGFRTIAFCEIDPYCRQVLAKHWPDVPIFGDIRTITAEVMGDTNSAQRHRALDGVSEKRGEAASSAGTIYASDSSIDVICGGFPCQDISVAGKGAGLAGSRSGLWKEYARIIGELRPRYVIVENVAALLSRGLGDVLGDLATLGFDAEWHCIPASAVGAPHRRDRIWIIAYPQREFIRQQPGRRNGTCRPGTSGSGDDGEAQPLAYPAGDDAERRRATRDGRNGTESGSERAGEFTRGGGAAHVAVASCELSHRIMDRLQGITEHSNCGWWLAEPDVGRVANGIPARVDRLKALGNAVVPQIPEIIGRAILAAEEIHSAK